STRYRRPHLPHRPDRARRVLRAVATVGLSAVALGAVAALLLVGVGPRVADYRTLVMLTGSMSPDYPAGSLLIATPRRAVDLSPGDVLTYHIPIDDRRVVTHRVVEVDRTGDVVLVRTKGDANTAPDPWVARITDDTVWTVRGAVPGAGQLIHSARSPAVRPIVTLALPGLAVGWLLVGIWRKEPEDAIA
ncbi:MAG: signal peptidase I, partial [Actinomycetota bacterium]|nr:signal peptidase I [Actinomycetota bacterium]